ncbi:period circadian protein homolog 1 [Triticum aestivum]|uniref:period circadian protein homolog 1 n=1 Tax=Triticum aestivum TaxID=4565 RepID=UPI001D02FD7F|nr:period circadian protein homolog 1-like [Triticum aestivum]
MLPLLLLPLPRWTSWPGHALAVRARALAHHSPLTPGAHPTGAPPNAPWPPRPPAACIAAPDRIHPLLLLLCRPRACSSPAPHSVPLPCSTCTPRSPTAHRWAQLRPAGSLRPLVAARCATPRAPLVYDRKLQLIEGSLYPGFGLVFPRFPSPTPAARRRRPQPLLQPSPLRRLSHPLKLLPSLALAFASNCGARPPCLCRAGGTNGRNGPGGDPDAASDGAVRQSVPLSNRAGDLDTGQGDGCSGTGRPSIQVSSPPARKRATSRSRSPGATSTTSKEPRITMVVWERNLGSLISFFTHLVTSLSFLSMHLLFRSFVLS